MATPLRLLLLEDNPSDAALVLHALRRAGFDLVVDQVETEQDFRDSLQQVPEIIIADFTLPEFDALGALKIMQESQLDIPFIVVSGTIGEERAVEIIRAGADDYLLKGNLTRLAPVVERVLREGVNRRKRRQAEQVAFQLAAIVESSDDAIISKTLDGIVTAFNAGAERLYGYRAEEAVGRSIDHLLTRDNAKEFHAILDRVVQGQRVEPFETIRYRRDGTPLDVSVSISPILDVEGKVLGVSSIARDITARKQSEKALLASGERYRTLIAATTAIVWDSPASGEFDSEQPSWTAFTGQTVDQHRGWGWLNVIHPDDREKSARAWATATSERKVYQVEHRLRRADGVYRQMSVRAIPVLTPGGEVREWVGVHTDITDQKSVEIQRDRLLEQLELQIERLPLAYLLSGPDLRYTRWNPAAEQMFGFAEAEIKGKHPFEVIVPAQSRPVMGDFLERLKKGDMHAHGSCQNVTRDGRIISCHWYNTPLMDQGGNFMGLLSLAEDITQRIQLEQQFRQAQKMEAFGQLAGGVAHDFNNLLTIINGYSEMLIDGLKPGDPTYVFLTEIRSAGQRSASLTKQLLAFSRKQVVAPRVLDLNAIVVDTEKMLRRLIGEDVRLTTSLAGDLGTVLADEGQLQQVLLNLAVNARDAMPQGGMLTIETRNIELNDSDCQVLRGISPGPYVLLSVSDTGCGISAEVKAHLFEPFFTTKEVGKGTGLGLAVVHGVVTQSGGQIRVQTKLGVGTTFEVYLPQADRTLRASKSAPGTKILPRGTETVLLVEDDDGVRLLTRHMLKDFGYIVLEAISGADALRMAGKRTGPIHLLITDVVMPGMSGRQVAEAVCVSHPESRVLFVSGYTDDAIVRYGILQNKIHFLAKPFSPTALACKIREVLDSADRDQAEMLT